VGDGILVTRDMAGAEDEVLVLAQRHLRVLRVRVGRHQRPDPAHLAAADPLPAPVDEAALGRVHLAARLGVGARERLGVRLRPDRHLGVEAVDLAQGQVGHELPLRLAALRDQQLGQALEGDVRVRVRASPDRGPLELEDQRRGRVARVDAEHLPLAQAERVVDEQRREPLDPGVVQRRALAAVTRKDLLTKKLLRVRFVSAKSCTA
jgi:hypothetical protein